jgi:hypothetical protein
MARKPGLKIVPLSRVQKVLERERRGRWDVYLPLSKARVDVRDSMAPLTERYEMRLEHVACPTPVRLTSNAVAQLASLAGVPAPFLERVPASLGCKLVRSLLELAIERDDRPYLLRLKGRRTPFLRAVLPRSFVRYDDVQVLADLAALPGAAKGDLRVTDLRVEDDLFAMRLVVPDKLELGTARRSDPAHPGIDVRSSETGRYPLEIRQVLFRVVCANGMTAVSEGHQKLRMHRARVVPSEFRQAASAALDEMRRHGPEMAARLRASRASYVADPVAEVAAIFRRYKLGSPKGRAGRWVVAELVRRGTLFGVERFDLVQAVTAVARDLDHPTRLQFEDAMGAYLMQGIAGA